jgi:hypothetical protein
MMTSKHTKFIQNYFSTPQPIIFDSLSDIVYSLQIVLMVEQYICHYLHGEAMYSGLNNIESFGSSIMVYNKGKKPIPLSEAIKIENLVKYYKKHITSDEQYAILDELQTIHKKCFGTKLDRKDTDMYNDGASKYLCLIWDLDESMEYKEPDDSKSIAPKKGFNLRKNDE